MMNLLVNPKKSLTIVFCLSVVVFLTSVNAFSQDRERVVPKKETKKKVKKKTPTATQGPRSTTAGPGGLTNKIVIIKKKENKPLVKKTASSNELRDDVAAPRNYYSATTRAMMMQSIRSKLGIRYRYGSQGPRTYDCSGFVWKVFQESGIPFTRTSARYMWRSFNPVFGEDRFKFGTLVFFNRLGHMGIVADKNGFYHASSSKGVTYSKFKGYWAKRIVGYRRIPVYQFGPKVD